MEVLAILVEDVLEAHLTNFGIDGLLEGHASHDVGALKEIGDRVLVVLLDRLRLVELKSEALEVLHQKWSDIF